MGVSPVTEHPPKLKKFHLFLRNCRIKKKYELPNYTVYYFLCGKEEVVVECNKENDCVETLRVNLVFMKQ